MLTKTFNISGANQSEVFATVKLACDIIKVAGYRVDVDAQPFYTFRRGFFGTKVVKTRFEVTVSAASQDEHHLNCAVSTFLNLI